MTLPPDLHRDLASLAVTALAGADLEQVQRRTVAYARRLPGVRAVGLFQVAGTQLRLLASEGWGDRSGAHGPIEAELPDLPAGTGADDSRLVAGASEHEILTVGRAGSHTLALVTVLAERLDGHADALTLLADVVQVAAVALERREVDDRLRTSERRLREAQRVGHMGSYDWHIATDTNVWSDELYRIYGAEPQSFNASYERFLEFVHPDDREKVKAVHAKAYAEGGTYEMEERIVRADGEVRVLETTGEVVTGPDGEPERMVGVCIDVTEQRREQQQVADMALALHDASTRRRQALEINDGVVQGLASVVYTLEAGDPGLALDAARRTMHTARMMMHDLMEGSTDEDVEGTLVRDAAPVSVLGPRVEEQDAPAPTRRSGTTRVLIVDDADDLRMLLTVAVSSREHYEVVGEAIDGAAGLELAEELRPDVVLLDLAMPVMDGFEALPRLRELLPDAVIIVLSGFDAGRMERRALELGADRYIEKGTPSSKLLTLLDELTHQAGSHEVSLPADPTAPSTDELGLQKLSHELRTPLTVIRSMIDTLHDQMDALPTAAVREILVAAARNADAMAGLIDSVAALQRIGSGEFVVAVHPADLGELIREQVGDLHGLTANHRVEFSAPDEPVPANVDPLRLRQVVTNLLSNATRYTPKGTLIRVEIGRRDDRAWMRVSDEGPGVPMERRAELFRRSTPTATGSGGMGLGLYISHAIARAHRGDLRYEPAETGGAAFVLEVPVAAEIRDGAEVAT